LAKVDTTRTEDGAQKMTDNLAQSDPNDHRGVTLQTESAQDNHAVAVTSVIQSAAIFPIIWTPRFIIIFCLLLASGLSGANMLTTGWLNQDYPAGWILIAYAVVNLSGWIAVNKCARSPLVRLGSIFGCLWAILMGLTFALSIFPVEPYAILLINTTAAASSALLACFICLSSARTPLQRWDRCFFVLAPIIGGTLVAVSFLYAPAKLHSFLLLKEYIVTAELWICTAIWWLRVSCWRRQPGPTLLLGIAPVIQIMLMQPANTYNETTVFFSQVMLLSIVLGTLRILQCELCH
jgi:hypothetical protein